MCGMQGQVVHDVIHFFACVEWDHDYALIVRFVSMGNTHDVYYELFNK